MIDAECCVSAVPRSLSQPSGAGGEDTEDQHTSLTHNQDTASEVEQGEGTESIKVQQDLYHKWSSNYPNQGDGKHLPERRVLSTLTLRGRGRDERQVHTGNIINKHRKHDHKEGEEE